MENVKHTNFVAQLNNNGFVVFLYMQYAVLTVFPLSTEESKEAETNIYFL